MTRGARAAIATALMVAIAVISAPAANACACGGPYTPALTTTGAGTAVQSIAVVPPQGGSAELLDNMGVPVTTWTDPDGAGTYSFDVATSTISFAPAPGFLGSPDPANVVGYRLTDDHSWSNDNTYTPTVTMPDPPAAPVRSSTGNQGAPQTVALVVPVGGSVTLLDGSGNPVTTLAVAGQGVFSLDPSTGAVTFAPVAGFVGDTTPVGYRLTDAYAQQVAGTVTVHVLAADLAATPEATPPSPSPTPAPTTTAAPAAARAAGTLPSTGSSTLPLSVGGAILLAGGAGLVALARRRQAQ